MFSYCNSQFSQFIFFFFALVEFIVPLSPASILFHILQHSLVKFNNVDTRWNEVIKQNLHFSENVYEVNFSLCLAL